MKRRSTIWRRAARIPGAASRAIRSYTRYVPDISGHRPGHQLTLLRGGAEAFPEMLSAIEGAKREVHFETYIWEPDDIGTKFAETLMRKAREGIKVRVIFDSFGSSGLSFDFIESLKDAHIEVLEYRPVTKVDSFKRFTRRNHRKILLVDGVLGFCGGINVTTDQLPRSVGGQGWRDTHLKIRGPLITELEELFRGTWHREGGRRYSVLPKVAHEVSLASGFEVARALSSDDIGQRTAIRRHYMRAIRAAQSSIFIANAYFAPDRRFVSALKKAAERGVDVRLLLPSSEHNDVLPVQLAAQHLYAKLMESGVRIYEWPDAHLHAKTAVIDGMWSTVGSYNLDSISLFQNLEVVVEVLGESFGATMLSEFERDFSVARELSGDAWSERPLWQKLGEKLSYRFRRFL